MTSHVHGNDLKKHIFYPIKFCITEVLVKLLGRFFDLQVVLIPIVRLLRWLVLGNSTEAPRTQLCGCLTMLWREAAWSKHVSDSLCCLNSRVTSRKRANKFQRNQIGRLCCNGTMAPAETLSSVLGGPYTVFLLVKVLPGEFRKSSRLVLPRLYPWLAWLLRIVWMTSLLSTEKTTIFSRWLVWRVLAAGCT